MCCAKWERPKLSVGELRAGGAGTWMVMVIRALRWPGGSGGGPGGGGTDGPADCMPLGGCGLGGRPRCRRMLMAYIMLCAHHQSEAPTHTHHPAPHLPPLLTEAPGMKRALRALAALLPRFARAAGAGRGGHACRGRSETARAPAGSHREVAAVKHDARADEVDSHDGHGGLAGRQQQHELDGGLARPVARDEAVRVPVLRTPHRGGRALLATSRVPPGNPNAASALGPLPPASPRCWVGAAMVRAAAREGRGARQGGESCRGPHQPRRMHVKDEERGREGRRQRSPALACWQT